MEKFVDRTAFKNIVAEQTGNELLMNASVDSWDMIFKAWLAAASDVKQLMIIDEFQYLGKANQAFPSVFQRIWDTMLKDSIVALDREGRAKGLFYSVCGKWLYG